MHARVPTRSAAPCAAQSSPPPPLPTTSGPATGGAATRFTTQAPDLSSEKARATALFEAYDALQARVAAWTTRLARELPSPRAATPPPAEHGIASPASSMTSSFHRSEPESQFVPPTLLACPPEASPTRRHTQAAGEVSAATRQFGFGTSAPLPISSSSPAQPAARLGSLSSRGHESNGGPVVPSQSATSTTSRGGVLLVAAAAGASPQIANSFHGSGHLANCNDNASTSNVARTPTTSTPPPILPPWLEAEMEAFFHAQLAPAIQARETALVNVMHECVQQELQEKERRVEAERQRCTALAAERGDFDKWKDHFQSKLDRRIAENNALRKDYYKQLLMLRDLVAKQRNDPRTLKALDEVISAVTQTKADGVAGSAAAGKASWIELHRKKVEGKAGEAVCKDAASSMGMRREKDKWEQRAKEAVAECQQLHEEVLQLKQQLEEARGLDGELWFATAEHGLYERQRIIDCVYKSKCSWSEVGDAIIELLNNDMVWEAVEDSAYHEKTRVSRGLEALLLHTESSGSRRGSMEDPADANGAGGSNAGDAAEKAKRAVARRRGSAFLEGSRLIACRTCNGCGFLDASAAVIGNQAGGAEQEDDSYLRKTLAQVLELKTSLEDANTRTNQVEQQLLRTVMEGSQTKEKLEKIEFTRAHGVDSCLQTDLDTEEDIDLDAIMEAYNNHADPSCADQPNQRRGGRWKQYEHLIAELKNLLTERDAGLAQLRNAVSDAQTRLVTVQKTAQQEQDRLQRELQTLKTSLTLAIKNRNDVIEEKQAAVNLLLKGIERKRSQALPSKSFLLPRATASTVGPDDGTISEASSMNEEAGDGEDEELDEEDDVKRSEAIARRYSEAISRVQDEYNEQQQRLKETEEELGQESDKRRRTSSISMGNIVVSMSSNPRDLFKALSTTHQELLNFRRSSQRSSALQTDRLLTLTTHLAHISEELAMVKKRTIAEIDFWKLDCEKLQNANKALAGDLEKAHQMLGEANERAAQASEASADKMCKLCDKHEARLIGLSAQLLEEKNSSSNGEGDVGRRSSAPSTANANNSGLTEFERQGLSVILVELESLYSTLSVPKQQLAKAALTRVLLSSSPAPVVAPQYDRRVTMPSARLTSDGSNSPSREASDFGTPINSPSLSTERSATITGSRLFQDPFDIGDSGHPTGDPIPDENLFMLRGASIPLDRPSQDGLQSHRRKKIVRKVLSEQEAYSRQRLYASNSRRLPASHILDEQCQEDTVPEKFDERSSSHADEDADVGYSTFEDEDGNKVFYVDIEEDVLDEGSVKPDTGGDEPWLRGGGEMQSSLNHTEHHIVQKRSPARRSEYTIHIPSPQQPVVDDPVQAPIQNRQLLDTSDSIDKDPDVIAKLRELVTSNAAAREALALANWRILVCHLRTTRDQKRLDSVNESWRAALTIGKVRVAAAHELPTLPQSVRTTMQKLVQYRELVLDAAIRQRGDLRRELRRAQAHLIHSVSTVLTTLSRKSKTKVSHSDTLQVIHVDPQSSPTRNSSPTHFQFRPLYPAVHVNLSEIPATQQVPTPSFPFSTACGEPGGSGHRANVQQKPSPLACAGKTVTLSRNTDPCADIGWAPSIFESDNHFPQRYVKFVPAGDGDELSLTHSTSTICVATSYTPRKSPSKAGLSLDARRRPTHSAGLTRDAYYNLDASFDPVAARLNAHRFSNADSTVVFQRPTRPQSSPAGMPSRARPSSATSLMRTARDVDLDTMDVRLPEYSSSTRPK